MNKLIFKLIYKNPVQLVINSSSNDCGDGDGGHCDDHDHNRSRNRNHDFYDVYGHCGGSNYDDDDLPIVPRLQIVSLVQCSQEHQLV